MEVIDRFSWFATQGQLASSVCTDLSKASSTLHFLENYSRQAEMSQQQRDSHSGFIAASRHLVPEGLYCQQARYDAIYVGRHNPELHNVTVSVRKSKVKIFLRTEQYVRVKASCQFYYKMFAGTFPIILITDTLFLSFFKARMLNIFWFQPLKVNEESLGLGLLKKTF